MGVAEGFEGELSGSEEVIAPANKKCSVMSLPATAPGAMMDLKNRMLLLKKVDGNGVKLCGTTKEAYEVLEWAFNSVGLMYDVLAQELLEAVDPSTEDIFAELLFLL